MSISPITNDSSSNLLTRIGNLISDPNSETHKALNKEINNTRETATAMLQKLKSNLPKDEQKKLISSFQAAYARVIQKNFQTPLANTKSLAGTKKGEIANQYPLIETIISLAPLATQMM